MSKYIHYEFENYVSAVKVACPKCGVPAGEECRGRRPTRNGEPWRRKSCHIERVQEAHSAILGG